MNAKPYTLTPETSSKALPQPMCSWAGARTDYPRNKTVAQIFEETAATYPDAIALVFGTTQLTYAQLNLHANRLAHRLRRMGVGAETMVGVCLDRSVELIIALVGILKAGGAFVPFDATYPRERLDFMLADTRTPVMVSQKSLAAIACGDRDVAALLMDDDASASSPADDENPAPVGLPTSLAYVMYTSGSTGRPKGVLIENRSIVRLVFNTNFCEFGPEEVLLQFAPVSFDASTLEIWGALLHGAKLVVMPPQASSLEELGQAIREHGVTTLWLTAGLFNLFVDERPDDLRPLKQLLAGGEALSARHVRRALEALPGVSLINGYGPTEGTTFTCCHVMRPGDSVPDSVPIGHPITNTSVYILDEDLRPVPPGLPGELCAAGDGVARGYLNAPDITAEKFLPDPFSHEPNARIYRTGDLARWCADGTVEFLGRVDNQVKILGHRIELGEIEAALAQHPDIRQVCVVLNIDDASTKRLVAYYVASGNAAISPCELKEFLSAKLPAYMVPLLYMPLHALPLNPNGKLDRATLPSPVAELKVQAPETTGSQPTQLEESITGIWKKVLRTERAGLDDNFFDLGGDSLLIVAVHSQLQKLLHLEMEVTDLFQFATIRTLAQHLGNPAPATLSFVAVQERAQKQCEAYTRRRVMKGGTL
jgi:amino acid adenylation domain-containing protein